jgi:replicative DNA helicase
VAEVSDISRGLKALARELQIPVIALSQLSRESERMGGRDPRLSDLRESGAIEQDADLVMLLSRLRPKKGKVEEEEPAPDAAASTNGEIIKLHLAKHRNGPTGEVQLWFYKRQTRFVTYVEDRYAEAV